MDEMYKISEVTKITGISRRALQGYDEMGLISPTSKTEGGYWLYNEEAVKKLLLIAIFVEAEYTRKQIKMAFELPPEKLINEYDNAINSLKEKKAKYDGMIRTLESMKDIYKMPLDVLVGIQDVNLRRIFDNYSFTESIKKTSEFLGGETDKDYEEFKKYSAISYYIYFLAGLKDKPCDSKGVQACVKALCDETWETIKNDPELKDDERLVEYLKYKGKDLLLVKCQMLEELIDSIKSDTDNYIDEESDKFIFDSCNYYINKVRNS